MALATTTLSLRARSDAGAADASGGLVRRRATASRRARVRVLASSMDADSEAPGTSDEYNEMMQKAMGNPYEYRHEDGIYYTVIKEQLIVGGQPQSAADVRRLARDEGVTHLVNLQQDKVQKLVLSSTCIDIGSSVIRACPCESQIPVLTDLLLLSYTSSTCPLLSKDIAYWGIDYDEIRAAAEEESVTILRHPARDFDPNSLRNSLPAAVAAVDAVVRGGGRAYVHCTAGLGRAPGVGIAYLYWCEGLGSLDEAYEYLTERRPCGPKREAVRGATHDLLLAEGAELGEWDGQVWHGVELRNAFEHTFQGRSLTFLLYTMGTKCPEPFEYKKIKP